MQKIKIYKRKIDKHMEQMNQTGFMTANFNSLANIHSSYLNGTVASFGRQSLTKANGSKLRLSSLSKSGTMRNKKTKSKSQSRDALSNVYKKFAKIASGGSKGTLTSKRISTRKASVVTNR